MVFITTAKTIRCERSYIGYIYNFVPFPVVRIIMVFTIPFPEFTIVPFNINMVPNCSAFSPRCVVKTNFTVNHVLVFLFSHIHL